MGVTFLWAFIDKVFGLGFATKPEQSWLNGGSPTTGFLKFGSIERGNPFSSVWEFFLSTNPVTDVLFMLGLVCIGLALILGIGHKIATISGIAIYSFMYLASFPLENNPLVDDHLIMVLVLLTPLGVRAADYLGLGRAWTRLVGEKSILR